MEHDYSKSERDLLRLQLELARRDLAVITSSRTWRMTAWIRWSTHRIKRTRLMRWMSRRRRSGHRMSRPGAEYRPPRECFPSGEAIPEVRVEDDQATLFVGSSNDLLVLIHVFYPELWAEIARSLRCLDADSFDLVVTAPHDSVTHVGGLVSRDFPAGVVLGFDNHGRDIWPMLQVLRQIDLSNYVSLLKLHTKRSPHQSDRGWRAALLRDLLPDRTTADAVVGAFRSRRDLGLVVSPSGWADAADWGPNIPLVDVLAARLGMPYVADDLVFPAGSMYWARPWILQRVLDARLGPEDFLPEPIPLDGTMAHAVERFVGVVAVEAGTTIETVDEVVKASRLPIAQAASRCRVGAFFLPQFHEVAENNEWWGPGYTEWVAVDRAGSAFAGHQLLRPYPGRRYDATSPAALEAVSQLMHRYGIDFIVPYFYWFDTKRLLEKPIDVLLGNPRIAMPFAYCWANEPWTRRWDGLDDDILQPLDLRAGWEGRLVEAVAPAIRDERYVRVDGRPMFIVYRPDTLPSGHASLERLRSAFHDQLSLDVFLLGVLPPRRASGDLSFEYAVDGLIAFPPNSGIHLHGCDIPTDPSSGPFAGRAWHYPEAAKWSGVEPFSEKGTPILQGVMPGWDNSPRRGHEADVFLGSNAVHFRRWLCRAMTMEDQSHEVPLVFVNAWNEWGEGAVLEPSTRQGFGNLDSVKDCKGLFGRHDSAR